MWEYGSLLLDGADPRWRRIYHSILQMREVFTHLERVLIGKDTTHNSAISTNRNKTVKTFFQHFIYDVRIPNQRLLIKNHVKKILLVMKKERGKRLSDLILQSCIYVLETQFLQGLGFRDSLFVPSDCFVVLFRHLLDF